MNIPIYNHQKASDGHSIIEHELHRHNRSEDHLRKLCRDFNPKTHGISGDHVLRGCLPGALKLEPDSLRALNQILPGVVFEMPIVRNYLKKLSIDAVRNTNRTKANRARNLLAQIVLPVANERTSTPITPHTANIIQFVAEDFYLVSALYKKETADGIRQADIVKELAKTYQDIPPEWIDAICQYRTRIVKLVYQRAGEITGSGGRGEYELWKRMNPGYIDTIKAQSRKVAASITLEYQ